MIDLTAVIATPRGSCEHPMNEQLPSAVFVERVGDTIRELHHEQRLTDGSQIRLLPFRVSWISWTLDDRRKLSMAGSVVVHDESQRRPREQNNKARPSTGSNKKGWRTPSNIYHVCLFHQPRKIRLEERSRKIWPRREPPPRVDESDANGEGPRM